MLTDPFLLLFISICTIKTRTWSFLFHPLPPLFIAYPSSILSTAPPFHVSMTNPSYWPTYHHCEHVVIQSSQPDMLSSLFTVPLQPLPMPILSRRISACLPNYSLFMFKLHAIVHLLLLLCLHHRFIVHPMPPIGVYFLLHPDSAAIILS